MVVQRVALVDRGDGNGTGAWCLGLGSAQNEGLEYGTDGLQGRAGSSDAVSASWSRERVIGWVVNGKYGRGGDAAYECVHRHQFQAFLNGKDHAS